MQHPSKPGRAALAAMAVGSLALVAACGSGGTQPASGSTGGATSGSSSSGSKSIAFSPISLDIPAMKGLSLAVTGMAKSKGLSTLVQDPKGDATSQVTQLTSVVQSGRVGGAWAIAIAPESLKTVIGVAQKAKVPLVLTGEPSEYGFSGAQPGITFSYIDYKAYGTALGKTMGECVNQKLGGNAKIIWVQNQPGTPGKQATESAAEAALKAEAPGAKVVTELNGSVRADAQTAVGNALQGQPDANAVMAGNDEAALGAIGAFNAAGKKATCVTETGGAAEVLAAVKSGEIYASVALQFDADAAQTFGELTKMMSNPTAVGATLTTPQKVIKAES